MYCTTYHYNDYLKKCGIEDFHNIVEEKFKGILAKICEKDLSFLKNDEERGNFSFYIGCQYTRTNKMRENLINAPIQIPQNIDKENIAKVLSLIFSDLIGNWVFSKSKVSLLINNTDSNFITGDQPIINTQVEISNQFKQVLNKMELFFPITPKLALYISNDLRGDQFLDKNEVAIFNEMILQHSNEQVYSIDMTDI